MNNLSTVYSGLDDEELLLRVYTSKPLLSALEIELARRLEHALDELAARTRSLDEIIATVEKAA